MGAGAGNTVQTNPQNEDTGRGDAQRMLTNETGFATMCIGHSESPIPLLQDAGDASWPRPSAVAVVAAVRGTSSGAGVGGDSGAGRPSVSPRWASVRCVSSTVVST